MFRQQTSGTTGKPLTLWFSRPTVVAWYALVEARSRRWYGVSRHDRWAILGGQLVTPVGQQRPPFWVWNAGLNQLYMSTYHLSPANVPHYLAALRRYRVKHVYGYASALLALATEALRLGFDDDDLVVAVSNAEPLHEHQRRTIERGLRCSVRETYGMSEVVAAAGECERGRLHAWPEVGVLEVEGGSGGEDVGDLVCTGLLNLDMPLIRYRVGDRAAPLDEQTVCPCGRTLPALTTLDGRSDDVLFTAGGAPVSRVSHVFGGGLPLREAQIVQESLEQIRVLYVPADGYTEETAARIVERLHRRLGDVRVTLESVDRIPRSANGKFRLLVNRMSGAERERARALASGAP
jgi:phenylacetate-CoA ligase